MHWRNSNFQYIHFIFGACHTAIEAHRKCAEAIEERNLAVISVDNAKKSSTAEETPDPYAELRIDQARAELQFLIDCLTKLETIIGFKPTVEDYQNNQELEWQLELEFRAENHLLCTGMIPPDHFASMRYHPNFPEIMAHVDNVKKQITNGNSYQFLMPLWKKEIKLLENDAVLTKDSE